MDFDCPATLPESCLVALREEPGHLFPGHLSEEFVANMAGTYERLEAFPGTGLGLVPGAFRFIDVQHDCLHGVETVARKPGGGNWWHCQTRQEGNKQFSRSRPLGRFAQFRRAPHVATGVAIRVGF